jgi:hypothetical protein
MNVARALDDTPWLLLTFTLPTKRASQSTPFFIAGALKSVYDLLLYRSFRRLHPPEEQ